MRWCNEIWTKWCYFCEKMCSVPTMTPLEAHYLPSHQRLHGSDTEKNISTVLSTYYTFCSALTVQLSLPFSRIIVQFFASLPILSVSISLSPGPVLSKRKSSISRMKDLSLSDCVRKVMTAAHHSPPRSCWLLIFFHAWTVITFAIIPILASSQCFRLKVVCERFRYSFEFCRRAAT